MTIFVDNNASNLGQLANESYSQKIVRLARSYYADYPQEVVFDSAVNLIFYKEKAYNISDFVGITLQSASKICQERVLDITDKLQALAKKRSQISEFRSALKEVSAYATKNYNADKTKKSVAMTEVLTITGSSFFQSKSLADFASDFNAKYGYDPFSKFQYSTYPTKFNIVSGDNNENSSANDFDNFSALAGLEDSSISQDIKSLNYEIRRLAEQATSLDKGARRAITEGMQSGNKLAGG